MITVNRGCLVQCFPDIVPGNFWVLVRINKGFTRYFRTLFIKLLKTNWSYNANKSVGICCIKLEIKLLQGQKSVECFWGSHITFLYQVYTENKSRIKLYHKCIFLCSLCICIFYSICFGNYIQFMSLLNS